jgi:hypothetical protein
MRKFRLFIDFQKEEKWLEHMASQGWRLKSNLFTYVFESETPWQANIKIDYRHFRTRQDFLDYCSLFEDSGWQHICGTKNSGTQYFKQVGDGSSEDIFSDDTSRAGRYKRLSDMMLTMFIAFFPLVIIAITQGTLGLEAFTNPRELYLTPGLWDLSGAEFWGAFLFETPFALMRGFSTSIGLLMFMAYVFLTIKSWILYKRATRMSGE